VPFTGAGRGQHGQAGGRAVADQPAQRGGVEVVRDQVAERVQPGLTQPGKVGVRGGGKGAASLVGGFTTSPGQLIAARAVMGLGAAMTFPSTLSLISNVFTERRERARAIGRPRVQNPYLGLTNYLSNLRRLGWTDADLADGGSDALIDALAVHGDAAAIGCGVTAHLEAGADHVAVQVLDPDPLPALRALASQLQLTRR